MAPTESTVPVRGVWRSWRSWAVRHCPRTAGGTIFVREMYELANREIREARESEERRRCAERRWVELLAATDGLLTELEELNVAGVQVAPAAARARAAAIVAQVRKRPVRPEDVPEAVPGLMDALFVAQDEVQRRRRRDAVTGDRAA